MVGKETSSRCPQSAERDMVDSSIAEGVAGALLGVSNIPGPFLLCYRATHNAIRRAQPKRQLCLILTVGGRGRCFGLALEAVSSALTVVNVVDELEVGEERQVPFIDKYPLSRALVHTRR